MAVYFSLLDLGDTVLGMRLDQGGHLTHGSPVNFSGRYYDFVAYGVDPATERIDMDEVRKLALEHRRSCWPDTRRIPPAPRVREVPGDRRRGRRHLHGRRRPLHRPRRRQGVSQSHEHADVVTFTTHKALRGARGGSSSPTAKRWASKSRRASSPTPRVDRSTTRSPAKPFASTRRLNRSSRRAQVIDNARAMAARFMENGIRLVSDGTDNHMMLIDLRSVDEELTGKEAAIMLEGIGITTNRNSIPFDPRKPFITSGVRMGTPAITSQGLEDGMRSGRRPDHHRSTRARRRGSACLGGE